MPSRAETVVTPVPPMPVTSMLYSPSHAAGVGAGRAASGRLGRGPVWAGLIAA